MSECTASTRKIVVFTLILVVAVSISAGYSIFRTDEEPNTCHIGKSILGNFQEPELRVNAPNTVFFDGSNNKRRLTDLKGKGIVLNLWATWCKPCISEMPQLNRLKGLLNEENIVVLAISQDRQGAPIVKKFLKTNKLHNLETFIDKGGKLIRDLRAKGLPTTILFNKENQEIGRVLGIAEWDAPETVTFIQKCLDN